MISGSPNVAALLEGLGGGERCSVQCEPCVMLGTVNRWAHYCPDSEPTLYVLFYWKVTNLITIQTQLVLCLWWKLAEPFSSPARIRGEENLETLETNNERDRCMDDYSSAHCSISTEIPPET